MILSQLQILSKLSDSISTTRGSSADLEHEIAQIRNISKQENTFQRFLNVFPRLIVKTIAFRQNEQSNYSEVQAKRSKSRYPPAILDIEPVKLSEEENKECVVV